MSVLAMLAALAPEPFASTWRERATEALSERCETLIESDGAYGERSPTYSFLVWQYLTLALPSLPEHARLSIQPRVDALKQGLAALANRDGTLPHIGDADDAVLLIYPPRAIALHQHPIWALTDDPATTDNPRQHLPGYGVTRLTKGATEVLLKWDNPPTGDGASPHVHDDILQALVRFDDQDVVLDGGTYSYTQDPNLRRALRGAHGHNAPIIDGPSSGLSLSTFRWRRVPRGEALCPHEDETSIASGRRADGRATRHVMLLDDGFVLIADHVLGASETRWRLAHPPTVGRDNLWNVGPHQLRLWSERDQGTLVGQRTTSIRYGECFEAPTLEAKSAGGWRFLLLSREGEDLLIEQETEGTLIVQRGDTTWRVLLTPQEVQIRSIEANEGTLV